MTGNTHQHVDIAIVGGGIIGLTLANLLSALSTEITVMVIDGGAPAPLDLDSVDARVIALSKANKSLFESIDVWESIKASRACPYNEMFVWDGTGTANIHFDGAASRLDNIGHIIENKVIVDALLNNVSGVDLMFNEKVTAYEQKENQAVIVLSNGESIHASLVVAADGARSNLRELAGFNVREWDYKHTAIVSTVTTEKPHHFTAWQRFTDEGPLAFLPLSLSEGDQYHCSIVWSTQPERAERLMKLDEEEFCCVLSREFETKLGNVTQAEKRLSFPLRQRHASRYTRPGMVLVGDAAHTIHPLAGQGANIGLYDVKVLSEEIARAIARGVRLSDSSIGKRYERRRQSHNLLAMSAMEGFKRLFGADDPAIRWVRNEGLRFANRSTWLKQQFLKVASGHT